MQSWIGALGDQLTWYWEVLLWPRLEGLTDDEYHWEPVPECWGVRPRPDGSWTVEMEAPEPVPAPVTTIAWRICHLAGPAMGARAANQFGDGWDWGAVRWPGTAAEGLAYLKENYMEWRDGVAALDDETALRPCGRTEPPFADSPVRDLVAHINREVFHHGGELGLLRDLYLRR